MGLVLEYIDGQTPLDEEEKDGLLIPTIATRGELDEFEQQNIEQALQWTLGRTFRPELVFTEDFIKKVHQRMYADVWAWAGEFRKTNKNIGVDKWQMSTYAPKYGLSMSDRNSVSFIRSKHSLIVNSSYFIFSQYLLVSQF